MELNFLPKLPKPNLDDRTFQDLLEECLLRIPRYCPEWTNYNPSDPGITFIELFAWLTDQMLFRFNQVPLRNYITFLELLGIRLQAAVPAQTDVTFYLTSVLPEPYWIPAGIEVATVRTEAQEAIVFSTDKPLTIGIPRLRHFLTAQTQEDTPQILHDRFIDSWSEQRDGQWVGREQNLFAEPPQPGNCFYLVFDPEQAIEANVLAITLRGEAATPTGINPDAPPRHWEAWDGTSWQPVLLQEADDGTRGFSFREMGQLGYSAVQGADVLLHMPQQWPVAHFTAYQGRWLRCVYTTPRPHQPPYNNSPRIVSLAVRAIGGTVPASQCSLIQNELLGESDGTSGQTFQLQRTPVLARTEDEYIVISPPGELPQRWQEVADFANSGPNDQHYVIDSLTGAVQFGPLIQEASHLKQQIQIRASRTQRLGRTNAGQISPERNGANANLPPLLPAQEATAAGGIERQYGLVPPRGSQIRMLAYRTGGGKKGNVQRGTLRIVKSAVPYVASVVNHNLARNGEDAESLEQAIMKVPQLLRTRDRAVTPEDFETLTLQAGKGSVARVRYLSTNNPNEPGLVRLAIVPQVNTDGISRGEGIDPEMFALAPQLREQILAYLSERKLLGVAVELQEPEYIGVSVQTEVGLEPAYNNPQAQQEILFNLRVALYRFLNPLTGGPEGKGWIFGRPVYPSDIVALFQQTPGVQYLGIVQLFELRKQEQHWVRNLSPDSAINPGPFGLVCSWMNNQLRSGHIINLI